MIQLRFFGEGAEIDKAGIELETSVWLGWGCGWYSRTDCAYFGFGIDWIGWVGMEWYGYGYGD